jgi:hypothetical protein
MLAQVEVTNMKRGPGGSILLKNSTNKNAF